MADTFIDNLDWVTDELITSTKFNQWWANMQNFHNGTALGDGIIVTRHLGSAANLKVPGQNLATSAILLGTASITSSVTSSTSGNGASIGLSVPITVPSGGRSIMAILQAPTAYNNTTNQFADLMIWLNGIGSGTRIGRAVSKMAAGTTDNPSTAIGFATPSAGSHTIAASLGNNGGGTANIGCGSDWPCRLLVFLV